MDRLTLMEAFVRVVDAGSFSAAARAWGRSKAVVSKYVGALEDHLRVELLHRTTRSLGLTDEGRIYHARCIDVLGEIEAMEASIVDDDVKPSGTLRVTAAPGFASRYLDAMTTTFVARFPDIILDLDLTHRMVDLIEEGIDVAIRLTNPRDSGLMARKLGPAPIVAVASPGYLDQHGLPSTPAQLLDHACLVDTNFRNQQRWPFEVDDRMQTVAVTGPVRANSPLVIRDLAVEGLGIALCPELVVRDDIACGRLIEVLPGTVALRWSIHAVYARRRFVAPRVRAYVDHLAAQVHDEARQASPG
jgi:DNA-binding transcriptional LysR family regulator